MKKRVEILNDNGNQFNNDHHTSGPSLPTKITKNRTNAPLDQEIDSADFLSTFINARFPRLKATPSFIKKLKEKL